MQISKSKKIGFVLAVAVMLVSFIFIATACGGSKTESVSTYEELVEALAGESEIVRLEDDVVVDEALIISREVVLDLNGKTLSNETDLWDETEGVWSIISVRDGGDLTVRGNGSIIAKENDCYTFDVIEGGHLIIEDGTYVSNISAVYVTEGSAEIKGGRFSIQQLATAKDYQFTLNLLDSAREEGIASIVVSGGIFENFDPAANAAESSDMSTNFVAEGYVSTLVEEDDVSTYVVTKA